MKVSDNKLLVCVVDDDTTVRDVLCRHLEDAGFATVQASDGRAVLGILKSSPVAAVVLDIIMPDQEGLSTIGAIRKQFPGMGILAMSGGGMGNANWYLEIARELGADDAMTKPMREAEFVSRVRAVIEGTKRRL